MDLKDKWRNITAYRPYGSHGMRSFIMVDADHNELLRADTGKPYHFKNRWPRDAALKAASRNEFYKGAATTTTIYIREGAVSKSTDDSVLPIVHVYEGTRTKIAAPPHLSSQAQLRTVWQSKVRKIREERYISKEDLAKF